MIEPFVIHLHSGYPGAAGPHYDLMLRRGDVLATWQMDRSPLELGTGQSISARKLEDHRLVYLTYEGPVSGGRGQVARQDEGTYELLAEEAQGWRVRFSGRRMRGIYRLCPEGADDWTLVCEAAGPGTASDCTAAG
jgi:hypothetical protein